MENFTIMTFAQYIEIRDDQITEGWGRRAVAGLAAAAGLASGANAADYNVSASHYGQKQTFPMTHIPQGSDRISSTQVVQNSVKTVINNIKQTHELDDIYIEVVRNDSKQNNIDAMIARMPPQMQATYKDNPRMQAQLAVAAHEKGTLGIADTEVVIEITARVSASSEKEAEAKVRNVLIRELKKNGLDVTWAKNVQMNVKAESTSITVKLRMGVRPR